MSEGIVAYLDSVWPRKGLNDRENIHMPEIDCGNRQGTVVQIKFSFNTRRNKSNYGQRINTLSVVILAEHLVNITTLDSASPRQMKSLIEFLRIGNDCPSVFG